MLDLMANRQRAPSDLSTVDMIERLTALEERDREKDAEIAALQHTVAALLRASTASIVRQAKVDADGLLSSKPQSPLAGDFSEGAVRKWIKAGRLSTTRLGGRVYVSKAEIETLRSDRLRGVRFYAVSVPDRGLASDHGTTVRRWHLDQDAGNTSPA